MRRMRGGAGGLGQIMSFGKSKAKRLAPDLPKIGFKDVAGVDEAVEELQEIKEFLADPRRFQALGARIPKGVLLYGPPGTGKTLLARAVAGEAGVPFFSISGSDFVEMFVGVGASRVRDLFKEAKEAAPCIVFVDELDAVGRHRGAGIGGGNDEREQTLNQLLVEMDGFAVNQNIILIGATNRPGRPRPGAAAPGPLRPADRRRPARPHRPPQDPRGATSRASRSTPEVDLDALAAATPGFTGAELSNLINEAALLAARRGRTTIGQAELEEGVMRVIAGPEKKTRVFSELERKITAYHEMGHALVGHFLEHTDPVHKISIVSRGQALGLTVSLPTEDRFLTSRSALMDQLAMILGGRAAEELVFDEITTGAANDLERATAMSRQMITRFGMSEKLGPRVFGSDPHQPFLGRELGGRALLLRGDGAGDRRGDLPPDRRGPPARRAGAARPPGSPARDRRDPDRARDDRQGAIRAAPAGRTRAATCSRRHAARADDTRKAATQAHEQGTTEWCTEGRATARRGRRARRSA